MAFLGNMLRSILGSEGPAPNTVVEVSVSQFSRVPVYAREDCLVLYGPTPSKNYELLLNKPLDDSLRTAFSLFRLPDVMDAQVRFLSLKEVLPPLVQLMPQVVHPQSLQTICDLIREHPTWTPAHTAAYLGYARVLGEPSIRRFVDTADMELKETPLHTAIKQGHVDVIRRLLEMGVSVDALDSSGNSVYHLAATSTEPIIQLVTDRQSTMMNKANLAGKTPLHLACEADKPECVKALLCAGADVNVAATHDSTLPIHSAMAANSTLCAKEIIKMHPNQLNVKDMKHGGTPLHWATSREMINAMADFGCIVNARNFHGQTALHKMAEHNRLSCAITLLSRGVDVNASDAEDSTALHLARSAEVLQALLVFGANTALKNAKNVTARHLIAASTYPEKASMLYIIHAVGAARCASRLPDCTDGCAPGGSYDGVPPAQDLVCRSRISYDDLLDSAMLGNTLRNLQSDAPTIGFSAFGGGAQPRAGGGRILCLDGGGMRGLVLIQLLLAVEEAAGRPVLHLFDWIAGTSTGAILALALAKGKSARYTQGLYFRMKDQVFVGMRPYDEKPLEKILKEEMGEDTVMADLKGPKIIVTGVLADRFPADLHLFRSYTSGEQLLQAHGGNAFRATQTPEQQLVWMAARASGAAPSYFRAHGRFIDGGLISNNPTLDVLTEIAEYNTAMTAVGRPEGVVRPSVVVSLGTGKPPVEEVKAIDFFKPESMLSTVKMAFGLSNVAKLLVDQATMADNRTVDRARAWCGTCNIAYLRLSPQLSLDVQLDETRDQVLVNMLWETMIYLRSKTDQIHQIAALLTMAAPPPQ